MTLDNYFKPRYMQKLFFVLTLTLFALSSCKKDPEIERRAYVPSDVIAGMKDHIKIQDVFQFINSMDHEVEYITSKVYTSSLPSDSLDYVIDYLNSKPYTNIPNWEASGYLHYQTKAITVFPRLYGMKNIAYQTDWLNTMAELQLQENSNGHTVFFHVPVGKEKQWVKTFKELDFVEWAELNHIRQIIHPPK